MARMARLDRPGFSCPMAWNATRQVANQGPRSVHRNVERYASVEFSTLAEIIGTMGTKRPRSGDGETIDCFPHKTIVVGVLVRVLCGTDRSNPKSGKIN